MCQPGKLASAAFTLNPLESLTKVGQAFQPKPPNFKFPKPPKPKDFTKDLSAAEQHAKEAAIGAYGASDTFLTGGKGLGSMPGKNLWKSLGAS